MDPKQSAIKVDWPLSLLLLFFLTCLLFASLIQVELLTLSYLFFRAVQDLCPFQLCSKNAEKVTHNKGRLLDQAVILFNCVRFQNGNFP